MTTKRDKDRKAKRVNMLEWAKQQTRENESTCIRLPDGVELFKIEKTGIYKLDFMLYKVGKYNPGANEGMEHCERLFVQHWVPTAEGNRPFACRTACFFDKQTNRGPRCAVCDWLRQHGSSQPELAYELRPQKKHMWLVNDKPGDTKNPLKVYITGHVNKGMGFPEVLADAMSVNEDYADFAEMDGGYTAQLTAKEQSWSKGKYIAITRIDFTARKYSYPESMIDDAPCLDDCIVDPGYERVMEELTGGSSDSGQGERDATLERPTLRIHPPNGKVKPQQEEDEDTGDDEPEEKTSRLPKEEFTVGQEVKTWSWGTCTIVSVKGDKIKLADEDEDPHTMSVEQLKKELAKSKPVKDDEEDDDDDDDSDLEDSDKDDQDDSDEGDDEPTPPKKKTKK